MGDVYRAVDPRLDRRVALKVLRASAVADPLILTRFQREARTLAALSHPNVVVLYDIGEETGRPYTVSELLEGETLRQRLDRGPISWPDVLVHVLEICDGLAAAHAKQVVHRDLKPENLMLTSGGRIKILDFGLAFFQNPKRSVGTSETRSGGDAEADTSTETVPGTVLGTTGYMSPEQLAGEETDPRTDLFSLGCVVYELLTSCKPFYGKSMIEVVTATLRDEPEPMVGSVGPLPRALSEIVGRCLAKDRSQRYQSADDLAADLRQVADAASGSVPVMAPPPTAARPRAIGSIAVFPLGSSAGRDSEYLSDGLTESLIRDLSRLEGVRVLAWSTVMRFRGVENPLGAARDLNVDACLTGRVQEEAGSLIVHVELVDCATGEHLWGDRFARSLARVFSIQQEISTAVSAHLQSRVATPAFSGPETASPEAYRAYLRGRHFWNQRSERSLRRSREQFQQALEHDPLYGRAWAGLADTYNVQPFWGLAPPTEAFPKAKQACRRAIELCPNLAEAHAARAYAQFYFDWRWRDAETSYRTALELDRSYATAHHGYGVCSGLRGHFEGALEQLSLAAELDPLSMIIAADTGLVHFWRGDLAQARRCCRSALDIDESFPPAHLYLGLIEEQDGRQDAAVSALRRAVDTSRGSTAATAALGHALARAGETEEAESLLRGLTENGKDGYVSCYPVAVLHLGLGRVDEAFRWLEKAQASRSETLVWLKVDPRLEPVREDARLAALAEEMEAG